MLSDELTDERIVEIFNKSKGSKGTQLLGFKVLESDWATGSIRASFNLDDRFTNPSGVIQGGYLAAALDEVMTVAAIAKSKLTIFAPSLEIKTTYLKAVKPGIVKATGTVLKLGQSVAFVEGALFDQDGSVAVKATGTSLVRKR